MVRLKTGRVIPVIYQFNLKTGRVIPVIYQFNLGFGFISVGCSSGSGRSQVGCRSGLDPQFPGPTRVQVNTSSDSSRFRIATTQVKNSFDTSRFQSVLQEDEHEMEVDTATSAAQAPAKHSLPELEIYCYLVVLIFLIDQKKYNEAKACSAAGVACMKNVNKSPVDVLAARLYFYYSLCYELTETLALHRIATVRHDGPGQEILLNLLLRNYLHYNLYDQAEKLRPKAPRFEAHSNQQASNSFSYLKATHVSERTIQLEYTDAKECLLQASRKALVTALGFRVQCKKWTIIVRLLLGEIPKRTVFMQKGMEKALRPYFELINSSSNLLPRSSQALSVQTGHIIVRLRHNVIRTGLDNLCISYSCISLNDVAKKLRLDTVADAESIAAKATKDGAIDATLEHVNGCMLSKETGEIYSTTEPQTSFNSRIAFCLNMHNEAVRVGSRQTPIGRKKVPRREDKENNRSKSSQSTLRRKMTMSFNSATCIFGQHLGATLELNGACNSKKTHIGTFRKA
ncbi:putative 26S proteasome non-ATPase regulatory subunit 3 [Hibiscus syriacus]|uniref:26S proteasome non-ATPase regulatory subunit 3 n=1 Tax=Hibiscus syriacus TaxID=106335 RepID=A0A6A3AU68_HIBSY|nr:putative 26S proteasome non-ATPase regulatory subunit 3 [Hibiscus syriacus]